MQGTAGSSPRATHVLCIATVHPGQHSIHVIQPGCRDDASWLLQLQAYLAGLTFALAASPCSTPVLATLLAYVASKGDLLQGGTLLLSYTSG